jgi:hypothetical protein
MIGFYGVLYNYTSKYNYLPQLTLCAFLRFVPVPSWTMSVFSSTVAVYLNSLLTNSSPVRSNPLFALNDISLPTESWTQVKVNVKVMLRPTVSRPVGLGIKHPTGAYGQVLLLSDSCWFVDVGRSLWREDGSVVYNCSWSLPMQTFSGPTPMGLVTIIYCLRFETSLFVSSYDSQGYGGGIRPRLHTGGILDSECTAFL